MSQPQQSSGMPGPWTGPGTPSHHGGPPRPIQPAPARRPAPAPSGATQTSVPPSRQDLSGANRREASVPSVPSEPPSQPIAPTAGRDVEPRDPQFRRFAIPVSTTGELPGMRIERMVGVVFGVVTRPRDLAHSPEMAFVNTSVRQDAVAAMVEQARQAGADGVVGLSFDGGRISESVAEVTAYGTAVVIAR